MAIEIVPLTQADIPAAVECVQKAFSDDPYFRWAFNDPAKFNTERNAASLAAHFQYGLSCDCPISVAKVASSQAARTSQTWSIWAQEWLLSFRQLLNNIRFLGRGGLNVPRYWIWKQVQMDAHDTLWTDPRGYYFCNMVGVSSQARGMGVGKRLMESVMEKADREGMPCYLESSKGHPNITIYEKMGFELIKEIQCVEGGDTWKSASYIA